MASQKRSSKFFGFQAPHQINSRRWQAWTTDLPSAAATVWNSLQPDTLRNENDYTRFKRGLKTFLWDLRFWVSLAITNLICRSVAKRLYCVLCTCTFIIHRNHLLNLSSHTVTQLLLYRGLEDWPPVSTPRKKLSLLLLLLLLLTTSQRAEARWLVVERYLKNLIEKSSASVCVISHFVMTGHICDVVNRNHAHVAKI